MNIKPIKLIAAIIICQLAGIIGSLFTNSMSTWYLTLNKPTFNPPSWLFGPVWITLYVLIGISLYLVWIEKKEKKTAIIFFSIQLVLNALWSILFFGAQSPLLAFIDILLLLISIIITMYYFYKINKIASYLLLPYLLWVSFATVLNFAIMYLNP